MHEYIYRMYTCIYIIMYALYIYSMYTCIYLVCVQFYICLCTDVEQIIFHPLTKKFICLSLLTIINTKTPIHSHGHCNEYNEQ